MIEIVTLFLGLASGPQPVELAVREGVAQVEVRLDGQAVERLTAPPWRLEVDLGEALAPHELVAVAHDESGRELGRARRWINLDRPRAEIDARVSPGGLTLLPVVFADDRIPSPDDMDAWFRADGRPLAVRAVQQGPAEVLVVQDPATRPYLEELGRFFLGQELDRLGFAGRMVRRDSADWDPALLRTPAAKFRAAARELLDLPPDASTSRRLDRLGQAYHGFAGLGAETTVRFISPLAAPVSTSASQRNLFAGSAGVANVGFFWLVENVPPMGFARRVADAVAIAGREAQAGGRRRAVVLLLAGDADDDSLYAVPAVRAYLRALRVPLFVWTLSPAAKPMAWGEATSVGLPASGRGRSIPQKTVDQAFDRFDEAVRELRRELAGQRLVLLEGEHLPHQIELAPNTTGALPAGLEPLVAGRAEGPR